MYRFSSKHNQHQSTLLTLTYQDQSTAIVTVKIDKIQPTPLLQAQTKLLIDVNIHQNHDQSRWSAIQYNLQQQFENIIACNILPACILKIHVFVLNHHPRIEAPISNACFVALLLHGVPIKRSVFYRQWLNKDDRISRCILDLNNPQNVIESQSIESIPQYIFQECSTYKALLYLGKMSNLLIQYNFIMKKTYDWDIKLLVRVGNNQKNIQVVASVHANIHQIKIIIAKQMGISFMESSIDLYYRGDRPLKPTSTLQQNDIKNGDRIFATISRVQLSSVLDDATGGKNKDTKKVQMAGLSIVACCSNEKCINYLKDIEIQLGFGTFDILGLTAFSKCELCPYKAQKLRPNMMCKQVKVNNCYYRLTGSQIIGEVPVSRDTGFIQAKNQKILGDFLNKHPWHIDMRLIIKHL